MENSQPQDSHEGLLKKIVMALTVVVLAGAILLGVTNQTPTQTLAAQAEQSMPLEVALANGQPTLMEFYADWCTSCQAMAGDLAQVKQTFGDRVNFTMINVDNPKWLPEMLRYRVDGIPHFVYLDPQGQTIGQAIGEQPLTVLRENLEALIAAQPLPYATNRGITSDLEAPLSISSDQTQPVSHGRP
jgi:thiol-disulfide isomerase/thioredoxin